MFKLFFIIFSIYASLQASQTQETQKVSLQLQWLDQFQFAGYYVAKERGFYEQEGLSVDIKRFKQGLSVTDEVAHGRADYGIGRTSLLVDISKGADIKLLMATFQASPLVVLARDDTNISSVSDFIGKKIMSTPELQMDASLYGMQLQFGVTQKNTKDIEHSFNVDDLISKKTDLMIGYISNEPYLMKEKGVGAIIFNPKDYGFNLYGDILFSAHKNNDKKRDAKFRRASLKGWKYAFANIEQTVDMILEHYNTQNKSREALLFEAYALKKLAYKTGVKLGDIDKTQIQRIVDIYSMMGISMDKIDIDRCIYKQNTTEVDGIHYTDEELEWKNNNHIVKIAIMNYWKYDKDFNSRHTDYIKLLNKYGNLDIRLIRYDAWKDGYSDVVDGKNLHGILNLSWGKEREEKHFLYVKPYAYQPNYLIVRDEEKNISSLDDLDGNTVYLKKSSITKNIILENTKDVKVIMKDNYVSMYENLSISREAVALVSFVKDEKLLKRYNLKTVQAIYGKQASLHLGINKEYRHLHSIIEKTIATIPKTELNIVANKMYEYVKKNQTLVFTDKEQNWITKHKKLDVFVGRDWYPFVMRDKDSGLVSGIAIDYLDIISKKSDIEFNYIKSSLSLKESIYKKEIDIISCIKKTPKNDKVVNISNSYISFPVVAVTRDDISFVSKLDDIQKKKFALVKDISSSQMLKRKYKYINYIEFDSELEALNAVSNKNADVFISNMATVDYLLKRYPLSNLKIAGQVELIGSWGIGLRKDIDPIAISIFNKIIASLDNKDKESVLNKWINIQLDTRMDYTILYQLLFVFLMFLLGTFYWTKKLSASKKEARDAKDFSSGIMNSQKDIIITIDEDGYLKDVNTAFFNFFMVEGLVEFSVNYGTCICDAFVDTKSEKYMSRTMDGLKYYLYMKANPDKIFKVVMKRDDESHIFKVELNSFLYKENEIFTLVFSDVTQLDRLSHERDISLQTTLDSIEYASHIQGALIPSEALFESYFDDFSIIWEPKHIVGGDIYLFTELNRGNQECLLMVIDCTGHGVSGAFVTMLVKAIERQIIAKLNSNRYKEVSPAWILSYFNQTMKILLKQEERGSQSNAGFDGQIIYYNKDTNTLKCSSARNEIFYIKDEELHTIKPDRHSVGYADSNKDYEFSDHIVHIDREFIFYFATDGYWDQCGGAKELSYGKKRFKKEILDVQKYFLDMQKLAFLKSLNDYQGSGDRNDDITVLAIKINPQDTVQEIVTILKHDGIVNQDIISRSIDILEEHILSSSIVKLVSIVFVELCQNIMNHSNLTKLDELEASIEVEKYADDEFSVFAKYEVSKEQKEKLQGILEDLNSKDIIAIRKGYKEIRNEKETQFSKEMIKFYEIAKIAQSIEFNFNLKNSNVYIFKFKAIVTSLYKRSNSTWTEDASLIEEVSSNSDILLSYETVLSQELLNEIVKELTVELHKIEGGNKLLSKISYIVIEQVQNILSYSADTEIDGDNHYLSEGVVMIGYSRDKESFFVATANAIKEKDIIKVSRKIDYINSLSPREKKDHYKKLLFSGENKHERGAGIGLISIARKSSQDLEYRLTTTKSGLTFQLLTYI